MERENSPSDGGSFRINTAHVHQVVNGEDTVVIEGNLENLLWNKKGVHENDFEEDDEEDDTIFQYCSDASDTNGNSIDDDDDD